MIKIVTDPLGNQVIVSQAFLEATDKMVQSGEAMDDIQKIIEKPAMLFKMKEDPHRSFYLRAVGWDSTILVEVHKTSIGFEVINYQLNPCMERMRDIHSKCERLI